MATNHSDIHTLVSSAHKTSQDSDEEHDHNGSWISAHEGRSYPSSDASSFDSPEHDIQTVRSRTGGGENEIEKLILAAEALALERAKFKLHGSLPRVSSLPQPLVKGTRGGLGVQSFSAATTVSAREAGNVHQRIKDKRMCKKPVILNNNNKGAMSMCTGRSDDVLQIIKFTSDQSIGVANCDGSGKNSYGAEKATDSPSGSFSDSVIYKTSASILESKDYLVSKENPGHGEVISSVPRLSLELTDESGYSSHPFNEREAMERPTEERRGDERLTEERRQGDERPTEERQSDESPTEERRGDERPIDERPIVSKNEKDECNSSIRGSVAGGQDFSLGPKREEREESDCTRTSLLMSLEQGEVSTAVKEGCGSLLTLALTSTNSLRRATRLVRQVVEGGWLETDTPRAGGGGLLGEVEEYEALHANLESQLSSTTSQLQVAISGVQELEAVQSEHEEETERLGEAASLLLQQVEASLLSAGLQHHLTVALTSPRRRIGIRAVESAGYGMTLVTGELERRAQRIASLENQLHRNSQEMQGLRETLLLAETRVRAAEVELREVKDQTKNDVTVLKQCLAQAEESLRDTQLDRMRTSEVAKKHFAENSAVITDLKKSLCKLQHQTDTRTTELEHQLQDSEKARQGAEMSLGEVRDQLTLRTQQMHLVTDENSSLIEGLRETLKLQKGEVEQVRHQLETAGGEKVSLSHTLHDLKAELSRSEERGDKLHEEISKVNEAAQTQQQEHAQAEKELQNKIDSLSMTRCELESQIRSLDLTVLQLRTELQMEQQRARVLADDNTDLQKKAKELQIRLWNESRRRRDSSRDSVRSGEGLRAGERSGIGSMRGCREAGSEYSSCANLVSQSSSPLPMNNTSQQDFQPKGESEVDEGRVGREERLHTLLREKDVELHSLHNSFSQQLSTKNQELESLTEKLECLEGELAWVVSGLEASAALGDVTAEVGRQLQARTHHLQDLDQDSRVLHQQFSDLATENQSLSIAVAAAKQEGQEEIDDSRVDARKAREEARRERVATAHIQEQCQKLQARLDSALTTLEQERRERKLTAVVQGVKQREFSTLLDSATAVLNLASDPYLSSDA